MSYNCGNPTCPIESDPGKEFERVIAYSMATLQTVFDLTASHRVKIAHTPSLTQSDASALRVRGLSSFLQFHEEAAKRPFDQSVLEAGWSALEGALRHFDDSEKLLFRTSIRPTEPTLAEMAFCRVVDGWKFYLAELSGHSYGSHKGLLVGEEVTLDEVLNETRNLFVHYGGVMGYNKMKKKKHADVFRSQLAKLSGSTSRVVDLCHHALGLNEGDRIQLGMRETINYLDETMEMLTSIEVRRASKA